MISRIFCTCIVIMYSMSVSAGAPAEQKHPATQFVPLAQYDVLPLSYQQMQSSTAGLMVRGEDVQFVGLYTRYSFDEPLLYDYPGVYHSIDALLEVKKKRNQFIAIFKSASDQPVNGGLSTYQSGVLYGYEIIHNSGFSLILGGGFALGDFDIKTSSGKNQPLIPVPLVRVNYGSNWLDAKFEFLTTPNLSFTIAPKNRVRFNGEFRMDQFRDARDIIFNCNLAYRFFSAEHKLGDFAGVSVGLKNDQYGAFSLGNNENKETLEVHYYSLVGAIDLSVVKISIGYAFGGRSLYRESVKQDMGAGYFVSVQGMYPF